MDKIYPHPNLPLLPKRLLSLIKEPSIHIEGVGDVDFTYLTNTNLNDIEESSKKPLIDSITSLIINIFFGKDKDKLSKITLNLPLQTKISDLKLNERARAALCDQEFFKPQGPWRTCSLMKEHHGLIPKVGPRLLLALLIAAEDIQDDFCSNSISKNLESELKNIVLDVLHSKKNTAVFLKAHGWEGKGIKPLSVIADELCLTHERVRQIVRNAEESMKAHIAKPGDLVNLRKAASLLAGVAPIKCTDASKILQHQEVTKNLFDVQGVLDASQFFGIHTGLDRWIWENGAYVRRQEARNKELPILMGVGLAKTLSRIQKEIRSELKKEGLIEVSKKSEQLNEKYGISKSTSIFAFEIYSSGSFIDPDRSWFVSFNPSERIEKIHALVKFSNGLTANEILAACDSSNFYESSPPVGALKVLMEESKIFQEVDGKFYVNNPLQFENSEIVNLEEKITIELKFQEGKISKKILRKKMIENGIKPEDFSKALKSSLIYREVGKSIALEKPKKSSDADADFVAALSDGAEFDVFSEENTI